MFSVASTGDYLNWTIVGTILLTVSYYLVII
jgi:hypothetical protein